MMKGLEQNVDVFQRNLLRKIIDVKWPEKISNEELYKKTNTREWSKTVKERRLRWYGHLLRLPESVPAKKALNEAHRYVRMPRGGHKLTWLRLVEKDLEKCKVVVVTNGGGRSSLTHKQMANNRSLWQTLVSRAVSQ